LSPEALPSPAQSALLDRFESIRDLLRELPTAAQLDLNVGDVSVRVVFGSDALRARIAPALSHLASAEFSGDGLEVRVLEFVPHLRADYFAPDDAAAAGENDIWMDEAGGRTMIAQRRGQEVSVIDWGRREAYCLMPSADTLSYLESAHPLQQLLTYCLGRRNLFLVHAAAVGTEPGGVLLLGPGGAGKSTTALLCLEDGMRYAADDHCLVGCKDGPRVHSLYATGKLAFPELNGFGQLGAACDAASRPEGDKGVLLLERLPGLPLAREMELKALVLPRITRRTHSVVVPASKAEAFRAIVPSCALHLPTERQAALDTPGAERIAGNSLRKEAGCPRS
jgi:hypothetical protein